MGLFGGKKPTQGLAGAGSAGPDAAITDIVQAARANDDERVDRLVEQHQHTPGFLQAVLDAGIDLWSVDENQAAFWVLIALTNLEDLPVAMRAEGLTYQAWALEGLDLSEQAIDTWRIAAQLGSVEAHFLLYLHLETPDRMTHLQQAAAAGHAKAQETLAELGLANNGTATNNLTNNTMQAPMMRPQQGEGHAVATWQEFVDYTGNNFPIFVDDDGSVRIDIAWNDGRSHFVLASELDINPASIWLLSPICDRNTATADQVLEAQQAQSSVMGVVRMDFGYALSHVMTLANVDGDEVTARIKMIAEMADEMEKRVAGGRDLYAANIADSSGGGAPAGGGFCPQCGTPRAAGAAFCGSCGTRLG